MTKAKIIPIKATKRKRPENCRRPKGGPYSKFDLRLQNFMELANIETFDDMAKAGGVSYQALQDWRFGSPPKLETAFKFAHNVSKHMKNPKIDLDTFWKKEDYVKSTVKTDSK